MPKVTYNELSLHKNLPWRNLCGPVAYVTHGTSLLSVIRAIQNLPPCYRDTVALRERR